MRLTISINNATDPLEGELLRLAGCPSGEGVGYALTKLHLMEPGDIVEDIRLVRDWVRGGAETFNLVFDVTTKGRGTRRYLIKACVAFSPGTSLAEVVCHWLERRQLLAYNGMFVPYLYGAEGATLLEDYIPTQLAKLPLGRWSDALKDQVFRYAEILSRLKFAALAPFEDLRTDGVNVYAVDFGEDLGNPGVAGPIPDYASAALKWINRVTSQCLRG